MAASRVNSTRSRRARLPPIRIVSGPSRLSAAIAAFQSPRHKPAEAVGEVEHDLARGIAIFGDALADLAAQSTQRREVVADDAGEQRVHVGKGVPAAGNDFKARARTSRQSRGSRA